MFSSRTLPAVLAVTALGSTVHGAPVNDDRGSLVQWGLCNETELPSEVPIECGTLRVPLDYTKSNSTATLPLELVKVPAAQQPSKGSIQFNFGGPGLPGRSSLAAQAPLLQAMTGGEYDLVAFDPRGTGTSIPFLCVDPEADPATMTLPPAQLLPNASDTALAQTWAQSAANVYNCVQYATNGSLVSTAFTARDLMQVAEALDEDGMLRFWGLSYGTTLGATVSAMFPDRIDKLILDGVQNPHEYYGALADFEEWTLSDTVFSAIFETCVANPENCTLAQSYPNATDADLEGMVWTLLDDLKHRPITVGPTVVDYTFLKSSIALSLYDTAGWPVQATLFDLILQYPGDRDEELATQIAALEGTIQGTFSEAATAHALSGIHCSDRRVREPDYDAYLPVVEQLYNTSSIYGDLTVGLNMECAQWAIEPAERYEGDFDVQTKNPVLILANSYDAHTPIVSARNVSSTFEGSVVLEIDGYGHGAHVIPSKCSLAAISAYWLNGSLPEEGTVCEGDAPPYSGLTWEDVLLEVAENATTAAKREVS